MDNDEADQTGVSRRQLLYAGGVIAAIGCFSGLNLREALAESQRLGKPLLTAEAFSARFMSVQKTPEFLKEIEAMKQSLPAYLESRYVLNDKQRALIMQLGPKDIAQLNANLDLAAQKHLGVTLTIPPRGEKARIRLDYQIANGTLMIAALT